jgi:ribosomal protein S4
MKKLAFNKYKTLKRLQVLYFYALIKKRKLNNFRYYIYSNFYKKKSYNNTDFFRVNIVEKPLIFRRKSKYCRYFLLRQFFRSYYGFLKINYIKKILIRNKIKKQNPVHFLKQLELRLDVLLLRLGFFNSIKESRNYILHSNVFVNNKKTKDFSKTLKSSDFLSLSLTDVKYFKKLLYFKLKNFKLINPVLPNYLNMNYNTLICMPALFNFEQVPFPFRFNENFLKSIMNYYHKGLF